MDLEIFICFYFLMNFMNVKYVFILFYKDWKIVFIDRINFDIW